MRCLLSVIVSFYLIPCASVFGQTTPIIEPGDRVRAKAPDCWGGIAEGDVEELSDGTLTVMIENEPLECSFGELLWMDRLLPGEKNNAFAGGFAGGVVLGGIGYLFALIGSSNDFAFEGGRGLLIAQGVVSGTVLGALIGSKIKSRRWQHVPVERLSLVVAPNRRLIGFGVMLRF